MSLSFVGLRLSSPPSFAVGASTATYLLTVFTAIVGSTHFMAKSTRDSGAKRAVPNETKSKVLQFVPMLTGLASAAVFLVMPFRGWTLPGWTERFALPEVELKGAWQLVGAGLGFANYAFYAWSLCVIGRKGVFSGFEARERHRLVDDGPFAFVRHPIYLSILSFPVIMTLSLWNTAPLLQFIGLSVLIPKIPAEEALIEDESVLGAKYTEYKRRVPYRIIPYLW